MKTKKRIVMSGVMFLLCFMLASTAGAAQKALICYSNDVNDNGFNQSANQGATRALSKYSQDLTLEGFINTKELALKAADITNFDEKWSFVIGIGTEYEPIFREAAKKHPLTKYIVVDSTATSTLHNLQCVSFNNEEMGYLAGVMAAATSTAKKIGFIGYDKNNLGTKEFLTGFTKGAAVVEPLTLIKSKFVKSYNNPKKLAGLADELYDSKIDVIFAAAGGSGQGLWKAAEKHKSFFIGCDTDQAKVVPAKIRPYVLSSVVKNMNNTVYGCIQECMEGKFKAGQKEMDYRNGGISYIENNDNRDKLAKASEALLDAHAQLTLNQADLPAVK